MGPDEMEGKRNFKITENVKLPKIDEKRSDSKFF